MVLFRGNLTAAGAGGAPPGLATSRLRLGRRRIGTSLQKVIHLDGKTGFPAGSVVPVYNAFLNRLVKTA